MGSKKGIGAIGIVGFAVILMVLAVGFAAPASARGGHHGGGHGHHSAVSHPHAAHPHAAGAQGSGGANRLPPRGHDKCVKLKGGRGFLPWCTDPAEGRLGSVTHRAEPNYPAAAIAHQAHRQRRVPVTSVEGPRPETPSHR